MQASSATQHPPQTTNTHERALALAREDKLVLFRPLDAAGNSSFSWPSPSFFQLESFPRGPLNPKARFTDMQMLGIR